MDLFASVRSVPPCKATVLLLGGTWNPRGDAIGSAFARPLDSARFVTRIVEYPADYGRALAYVDSIAAGEVALRAAIESTAGNVVLAGYSQGTAAAGNVAATIGRSEFACPNVIACALIADPLRPQEMCIGPEPGGYGIAGRRDWGDAAAYARGYLVDGRHTLDYLRDGHVARLAELLGAELDTCRAGRRG